MESEWIFPKIMEAVKESHLWLESVETPLFGNRASYCAISGGGDDMFVRPPLDRDLFKYFPFRHLKHVAITNTHHMGMPFFWSGGLERLTNLEYLEITLSRHPEDPGHECGPLTMPVMMSAPIRYQLEKLVEFRLMADHQHSFAENDILHFLNFFPNLQYLALGHILLANLSGNWSSLLNQLTVYDLEELWLLDPRNLVCDHPERVISHGFLAEGFHHHYDQSQTTVPTIDEVHNTDYHMEKYVEDEHLLVAAQKVRLIDTGSLWTDKGHAYPGLRRDFEYPGFSIFEQTEDGY
jgi:hypothetical protein